MADEFTVTDEEILAALRVSEPSFPRCPSAGPWALRGDAKTDELVIVAGQGLLEVARVAIPTSGSAAIKTAFSNAELITAAPTLLAALRSLVSAAEEAGWDIGENAGVLNAGREALASAEGRR